MYSNFQSFEEYISILPHCLQTHGTALRSSVEQIALLELNADLTVFMFLPDQKDHPIHSDAKKVFSLAADHMYGRAPLVGNEVPLLYLGYHVRNSVTGKRTEQGMLLTDQAIYVQDTFSILFETSPAQSYPLPDRADEVHRFVAKLMSRFKGWKDWSVLAEESEDYIQSRCEALMAAAASAVVTYHTHHGSQRKAEPKVVTLQNLIEDHKAAESLLDPANPKLAKKLAKVAGKFQVPTSETLHFALADFPFFGGPYGMALTSMALYTRDIMEEPVRIPIAQLDADSLHISDKGDQLLNNQDQPITIPAFLDGALRRPLVDFIRQEVIRLKTYDLS